MVFRNMKQNFKFNNPHSHYRTRHRPSWNRSLVETYLTTNRAIPRYDNGISKIFLPGNFSKYFCESIMKLSETSKSTNLKTPKSFF